MEGRMRTRSQLEGEGVDRVPALQAHLIRKWLEMAVEPC